MIRNHVIASIKATYTREVWPTDVHGERQPGESAFYPNQEIIWTIIAPSPAQARAWALKKEMKDLKVIDITCARPDAVVIEFTW